MSNDEQQSIEKPLQPVETTFGHLGDALERFAIQLEAPTAEAMRATDLLDEVVEAMEGAEWKPVADFFGNEKAHHAVGRSPNGDKLVISDTTGANYSEVKMRLDRVPTGGIRIEYFDFDGDSATLEFHNSDGIALMLPEDGAEFVTYNPKGGEPPEYYKFEI